MVSQGSGRRAGGGVGGAAAAAMVMHQVREGHSHREAVGTHLVRGG